VKKQVEIKLSEAIENHFTLTEDLEKLSIEFDEPGSKIITKDEDRELLKKWLGNEKDMKFKLLYRASGKTYTFDNFNSKCHNIPHTIVIIRSDTGKIFGGYADQTWDASGHYKVSDKVFIFDINEKKQYLQIDPRGGAMYCTSNGPIFGTTFDFNIGKTVSCFMSQNVNNGQSSNSKTTRYSFMPSTFYEGGQGQMMFSPSQIQQQSGNVDCIEVFQLEYPGIEKIEAYVVPNQFGQAFPKLPGKKTCVPASHTGGLFGPPFNVGGQGLNPGNGVDSDSDGCWEEMEDSY